MRITNPPTTSLIMIWDSNCSFCQRWAQRVQKLDRQHQIHTLGSAEVTQAPRDWISGWSPDILEKSMWVKDLQNGETFTGFQAIRRLIKALPGLRLLAPLLQIPPVPWLGERLYAWIAKNRYQFGCEAEACELPPPHKAQ